MSYHFGGFCLSSPLRLLNNEEFIFSAFIHQRHPEQCGATRVGPLGGVKIQADMEKSYLIKGEAGKRAASKWFHEMPMLAGGYFLSHYYLLRVPGLSLGINSPNTLKKFFF